MERPIEIDLERVTLVFDGRVLEVFAVGGQASRWLVRELRFQEKGPDRKGSLQVALENRRLLASTRLSIPAEKLPEYQALASALEEAGAERAQP